MADSSTTLVKISAAQASQLDQGLGELNSGCMFLDRLISGGGQVDVEHSALLALIQKAGALIETSLREAGILEGPAVVGTASAWLDIDTDERGVDHD